MQWTCQHNNSNEVDEYVLCTQPNHNNLKPITNPAHHSVSRITAIFVPQYNIIALQAIIRSADLNCKQEKPDVTPCANVCLSVTHCDSWGWGCRNRSCCFLCLSLPSPEHVAADTCGVVASLADICDQRPDHLAGVLDNHVAGVEVTSGVESEAMDRRPVDADSTARRGAQLTET